MPWNRPPLATSSSGGASMCRMPAPADGVLVPECAIDHVGNRLETTVRMPGSALRLAGGILDLTHLVHVDERIETRPVDAGEGSANGEALSFESRGCRRDRDHRP